MRTIEWGLEQLPVCTSQLPLFFSVAFRKPSQEERGQQLHLAPMQELEPVYRAAAKVLPASCLVMLFPPLETCSI